MLFNCSSKLHEETRKHYLISMTAIASMKKTIFLFFLTQQNLEKLRQQPQASSQSTEQVKLNSKTFHYIHSTFQVYVKNRHILTAVIIFLFS